jgi:hypothetical protein
METKTVKSALIHTLAFLVALGFYACQMGEDMDFSQGEGTGGSMARFTLANNSLFTVDNAKLKVFDLANPEKPVLKNNVTIGIDVETIFPYNNYLFLGTSTGMHIYDITIPAQPKSISLYQHVYSCDPVVTDGKYAYVTLSTANAQCWRAVNELQIIDLTNIKTPVLVKQYAMTQPRGLAVRNDTLWVCDAGLKMYDVKNKMNIKLLKHFTGISAYDVIWLHDLVLVTGETGFVQYRLENNEIKKLSELYVRN